MVEDVQTDQPMHSNDDFCFICKNGDGILICCDKCEHAFHEECLGLESDSLPDPWFCQSCFTLSAEESNGESESSKGGVPSAPLEMQLKNTLMENYWAKWILLV